MPLEPIFGWVKHQVLGNRLFDTVAELQKAAESHFYQRVADAQRRRNKSWDESLEVAV
jgi:hypothetical protein